MPGWQTPAPTDSSGTEHPLYMQSEEMSCALACVAMVICRVEGSRPTESALKDFSKKHPGAYNAAIKDRKQFVAVGLNQGTPPNMGNGTYSNNIASILDDVKILNAHKKLDRSVLIGSNPIKTAMKNASLAKPLVMHVRWSNGGGHFVLCDGTTPSNHKKAIICDPFYGYQEVDIDKDYKFAWSGATMTGEFTGFVVRIDGLNTTKTAQTGFKYV